MADKKTKTVKLYHPTSKETEVEVPEARAEVLKRRGYVTKKSDIKQES